MPASTPSSTAHLPAAEIRGVLKRNQEPTWISLSEDTPNSLEPVGLAGMWSREAHSPQDLLEMLSVSAESV